MKNLREIDVDCPFNPYWKDESNENIDPVLLKSVRKELSLSLKVEKFLFQQESCEK